MTRRPPGPACVVIANDDKGHGLARTRDIRTTIARARTRAATMLPKKDGQSEHYALEDMISDLQARRHSLDHEDLEDPVELLKKRDRDVVLAAELGKALLERNQELTKQNEVLLEEYSSKLEVSVCTISPHSRTIEYRTRESLRSDICDAIRNSRTFVQRSRIDRWNVFETRR